MNLDTIRHMMNIDPFEPFEIRLANGDRHQIHSSDNIAVGKSTVMIAYDDSNRIAWCTPHQIVSVEKVKRASTRSNGRKKPKE
jgi:hypothetical protein